ncbi:MAG: DUF933 domain-containing protein [Candidatus Brocadiia bacterium]
MIVGIVGLPRSGKTTVFNAITGSNAPVDTFTGAETTHTATVWVPDARLEKLREVCHPKKYTPASIQFRDFSIVSGEGSENRDKNPQLFAAVREVDAIVKVARGFPSIDGTAPNPEDDLDRIGTEFLFADLEIIEKRIDKLERSTKKPHINLEQEKRELELLKVCHQHLLDERPISEIHMNEEQDKLVRGFRFLTQKPVIVILNSPDEGSDMAPALAKTHPSVVDMRGRLEMEIAQLPPDDRKMFMDDMGITDAASARIVRACYGLLGLISFFTVGPDEVRAWTIGAGEHVVKAAGTIHTDLAKGFIRAEVINFADTAPVGHDFKKAHSTGLTRLEGREYQVRDGDIIEIRFNI